MRARLVTRRPRGKKWAEQAELVEPSVLTIGRGTDNTVALPGLTIALHHATIEVRGGQIHLEPVETNDVVLNGRRVRGGRRLSAGDEIRIGPHRLRVTEPEALEDVRLEIELAPEQQRDPAALAKHAEVATEPRWLSRRAASWLLVLGIPIAFLAVPLVTGSQDAWNSGTVSRPHSYFANECGRCHEVGFQRVQDTSCLACHSRVGHHADEEVRTAELTGIRCAECHMEHNGHAGLAILEQQLCSDCHADLQQRFANAKVENASDFLENHPAFQIALVTDPAEEPVEIEWPPARGPLPEERSGLKFPHAKHIGRVVRDFETKQRVEVRCNDCHVPDKAGLTMEPIVFERHCESCHALGFGVTHGEPVTMRNELRAHFGGFSIRGQREVVEEALPRRAPGRKPPERERYDPEDWSKARREEVERAAAEVNQEFEERICNDCHEIRPGAAEDGGFDVAPVQVAQVWMPQAGFSHRTHEPFPCRDCHAGAAVHAPEDAEQPRPAWSLEGPGNLYSLWTPEEYAAAHPDRAPLQASEAATDILIPGIEGCNGCHAGADAGPGMVGSDCVLCHPYHRDELGPMRATTGSGAEPAARRSGGARTAHALVGMQGVARRETR